MLIRAAVKAKRWLRKSMASNPSSVFPSLNQPIDLPEGYSQKDLMLYLQGFALDGSKGDELINYHKEDLERFLDTL